jgi:hypothetical protein
VLRRAVRALAPILPLERKFSQASTKRKRLTPALLPLGSMNVVRRVAMNEYLDPRCCQIVVVAFTRRVVCDGCVTAR